MSQVTIIVDKKKLLKKFREILESLEQNKAEVIGRFIEEEVIAKGLSVDDFAELVKNDFEGYSPRTLRMYRKIYKAGLHHGAVNLDYHKQEILAGVEDKNDRDRFTEIAEGMSREELRQTVNEYKEDGKTHPFLNKKSIVDMQIKYEQATTKLALEMRTLRKAFYQIRTDRLWDNIPIPQRKHTIKRIESVEQEYSELISEFKRVRKYLEGQDEKN